MSEPTDIRPQRIRKYDKSYAQIILRVRQYFEHERLKGHRINLRKVVERTAAAAGASHNIVARIKTEDDVENWRFNSGEPLNTLKKSEIPEKYSAIVRYVIRDIYLAKTVVPSVDRILDKISAVKVQDVQHLNLFDESELYEDEALIWWWEELPSIVS